MKNEDKTLTDRDKILLGMEKVYDNLIEFKRKSKSDIIVIQNNHIKRIKPQKI